MTTPLPLDPEAASLAPNTVFADSEGGPLIVMSRSAAPRWGGVFDDAGANVYGSERCDYDRACEVAFAVIDVGDARALTLETPDNSAFVRRPEGALIARWVGADDATTLLTAALALPDQAFTESVGELPHDGGPLVMFDSASRGAALDPARTAEVDLPAGVYAVDLCVEWAGDVIGDDGAPHQTMLQALRLRRV